MFPSKSIFVEHHNAGLWYELLNARPCADQQKAYEAKDVLLDDLRLDD
jgi:hypothetical protein